MREREREREKHKEVYLCRKNISSRSFRTFQRLLNDISQAILDVWRERFGDVVGNNETERLRDRLDGCSGEVREVFRSR